MGRAPVLLARGVLLPVRIVPDSSSSRQWLHDKLTHQLIAIHTHMIVRRCVGVQTHAAGESVLFEQV